MKKLLTILSTLTISMTGVTSVVACSANTEQPSDQLSPEKVKAFLKTYQNEANPFTLSRDDGNQQNRLVKDITQQLHLTSEYEVSVLENGYLLPDLEALNRTEVATIRNGEAKVSVKYQGKEFWNDKIFWLTNDLSNIKTKLTKLDIFTESTNGFVVPGAIAPNDITVEILTAQLKKQFQNTFKFNVQKITDIPSLNSTPSETQDAQLINYGKTLIEVTTSNDIAVFNGEINWVTEPINTVAGFAMDLMGKGHSSNNGFDFKLPIPGLPIEVSLGNLYTFAGLINTLIGNGIKLVNLDNIGTDHFDNEWQNFLTTFDGLLKSLIGSSIINIPINIDISGTLKVNGTVGELLTNMAPSLMALLQWFISNDFKSHNAVMELLQYLLSDVNPKVKAGLVKTYGEKSPMINKTNTNLDSLLGQALVGYKKDLPFSISLNLFGSELKLTADIAFGPLVKLEPTTLVMSILNEFSTLSANGFDLINQSVINKTHLKGVTKLVLGFIPEVNLTLKDAMGPLWNAALPSLGFDANQLEQLNVELLQGRLKVMFKNQNDQWEEFQDVFKDGDTPNLKQILAAKDMKLQFTNLQFKLTSKVDANATFTTNNDLTFEMLLSDKTK
ncbi:hypothetical protein SSYRP_v1c06010 [Spiroplasma syrphidicola EA-1]|uniref:Lipoprotein n=1 Tax=Spiroplasma syrphidicola EA-1 TaxID=1276229 RepID=R4ULV1_9MOLU|nr:lipoprotein [Spiroplasma syrphidicola]AGM26191.1 hypothetical protein SSYRP_v1c06010 [Spiroplasma syrphidicola EA-1]